MLLISNDRNLCGFGATVAVHPLSVLLFCFYILVHLVHPPIKCSSNYTI